MTFGFSDQIGARLKPKGVCSAHVTRRWPEPHTFGSDTIRERHTGALRETPLRDPSATRAASGGSDGPIRGFAKHRTNQSSRTDRALCRAAQDAQAGFTLIELLVVLAILGLLVAVATPQVLKYLGNAKVSTARLQIHNLSSALDLFELDVGRYPMTQEGLAALVTAPSGIANWNGPYLKPGANLNDPWGHPYTYVCPGEHGDYDLSSAGPDNGGGGTSASPTIASWSM